MKCVRQEFEAHVEKYLFVRQSTLVSNDLSTPDHYISNEGSQKLILLISSL